MNFLHYEFDTAPDDVIEVTLDRKANVLLLDDSAFESYRSGAKYRYYGGFAQVSPVHLPPPHPGHWHVVIDLGGYPGTVRAAVRKVAGQLAK
jgi:hypothetical protein